MEQEKLEINQEQPNSQKKLNSFPQFSFLKNINFLAGISVGVLVVVMGSTWWAVHTITASNKPSIPTILVPGSENSPHSEEKVAEIYWLKTTAKSLEFLPIPVTMEKSLQPETNLTAMLQRLLAGVKNQDYTSAIPQGTKLIEVKIRGNEVFVNLSKQFTTGGGSASMIGRLGQVIYTASSLNPKAKVWLEIEGKTLEVLGGEGVMLEQPLTRQYFEANMINFAN